jgi:hypothetical protein
LTAFSVEFATSREEIKECACPFPFLFAPSSNWTLPLLCWESAVCSVEFATSREEIEEEYKQRLREYKRSRSQV